MHTHLGRHATSDKEVLTTLMISGVFESSGSKRLPSGDW